MKKVKGNEAKNIISSGEGVVFLEFSTTGCGDCKMMEPFVKEVEQQFDNENVLFLDVDAEEANEFRKSNDGEVLKVPSFFVIKNNQKEHIGYEFQPKEKLINAIKKYL